MGLVSSHGGDRILVVARVITLLLGSLLVADSGSWCYLATVSAAWVCVGQHRGIGLQQTTTGSSALRGYSSLQQTTTGGSALRGYSGMVHRRKMAQATSSAIASAVKAMVVIGWLH